MVDHFIVTFLEFMTMDFRLEDETMRNFGCGNQNQHDTRRIVTFSEILRRNYTFSNRSGPRFCEISVIFRNDTKLRLSQIQSKRLCLLSPKYFVEIRDSNSSCHDPFLIFAL